MAAAMFGYDALKEAAHEQIDMEIDTLPAFVGGDSPIEELLITAVIARGRIMRDQYAEYDAVDEVREAGYIRACPPGPMILIRPQAQLALKLGHQAVKWRVDYLIHASGYLWRGAPVGWRRLIIECDGHEFHERTKQQASRDRSRDRAAVLAGYDVLRFTGAEIWRDAWGCAGQIRDWAEKGLA